MAARTQPFSSSSSEDDLSDFLRSHVFAIDAGNLDRLLHRVASERLAKLLVKQNLDERCEALLLIFAGLPQRFGQFGLRLHDNALQTAAFGHSCVAQIPH